MKLIFLFALAFLDGQLIAARAVSFPDMESCKARAAEIVKNVTEAGAQPWVECKEIEIPEAPKLKKERDS